MSMLAAMSIDQSGDVSVTVPGQMSEELDKKTEKSILKQAGLEA